MSLCCSQQTYLILYPATVLDAKLWCFTGVRLEIVWPQKQRYMCAEARKSGPTRDDGKIPKFVMNYGEKICPNESVSLFSLDQATRRVTNLTESAVILIDPIISTKSRVRSKIYEDPTKLIDSWITWETDCQDAMKIHDTHIHQAEVESTWLEIGETFRREIFLREQERYQEHEMRVISTCRQKRSNSNSFCRIFASVTSFPIQ